MQHAMHCADYYKHLSCEAEDYYMVMLAMDFEDIAWQYLLASCETVTLSAADPNAQHS